MLLGETMSADQASGKSHYNYIRRSGRITKAQSRGYEENREQFHVSLDNWSAQQGPLGVEVGFGMGDGLLQWAIDAPAWKVLGIELYRPGVGALATRLNEVGIQHVALVEQPAQEVFAALRTGSIHEVRIFFPDPWPKKRHAKRRLIQPSFIDQVAHALCPGGILKIATDWDPYAAWIREVMAQQKDLVCTLDQVVEPRDGVGTKTRDQTTKFERRGQRLGHRTHDLVYALGKNSETTLSK